MSLLRLQRSARIVGAVWLLCSATPVAAQLFPSPNFVDLRREATERSTSVTTTIRPACALSTPRASVRVTALLSAAPLSGFDTGATQLVFGCNTPTAMLSISSSGALVNNALQPTGREALKFTKRLAFLARADLMDIGQTSGESIWTMSDSATIGPSNLAVGVGTGQRIRTVLVSARGINSGGLIPIAGAYTGSICVGVDPAGVIGAPGCFEPFLVGPPE